MNILFYYYSGTGHTEYLAKKMQENFNKQGSNVTLCDVTSLIEKKWLKYNIDDFDIVGFGYPIYAFSTPKNFDEFVKNLDIKNKKYFILKNSREALSINDSSSKRIVKLLKKKGCNLILEKHLLLPYNIHFRHDDRLVKQMLISINEKLPKFVQDVLENKCKKLHFRPIPSLCAKIVGGILWKGAKNIGNSFYAKSDCISCEKCAKQCPNNNIVMTEVDGKKVPNFNNNKCMICMRCVMHCPTKSIVIGKHLCGWEVYGKYDFDKILLDDNIKGDFITKDYKGSMARSYKKYFFGKEK